MIPADVASRLQVSSDAALRPVAPSQEISDKLAGLVAGQKVMAEVQAMLPNGTYRAIINQRNITLALPFSAKAGDSLELQVTESDGQLALAVVSQSGKDAKPAAESASATLSRTGQLISTLYSGAQHSRGQGQATALPLNANQPIAAAPPDSAGDLVPLLKQAITQSGMFYESHQAEWVEGRLPTADLLKEPQGKHASPTTASTTNIEANARATAMNEAGPNLRPASDSTASTTPPTTAEAAKPAAQTAGPSIAPTLQPLVQQQLEALATQNFSWQGQIWPGQDLHWKIDEQAARTPQEEGTAPRWTTRLGMTLPRLGEIDARIQLQGDQLTLSISAHDGTTRDLMRASGTSLRSQLDEAGLTLTSMGVDTLETDTGHGQS